MSDRTKPERGASVRLGQQEGLLDLVRDALNHFEKRPLSASVRSAYRIAHLRGDVEDAWFFSNDLKPMGGSRQMRRDESERLLNKSPDVRERVNELLTRWTDERQIRNVPPPLRESITEGNIMTGNVEDLEVRRNARLRQARALDNTPLHEAALDFIADFILEILGRTRQRTFDYFCRCETEMVFSQSSSDVFARYRMKVDRALAQIAPDVLDRLNAAYSRVLEGTPEAGSQALGSCRRVLQAAADIVFPAQRDPWIDGTGVARSVDAANYRNRLWAFVADSMAGQRRHREVFHATLEDVGGRIDAVDNLASKGVHADVTASEVELCFIQTYILVGEVLEARASPRGAVAD